MMHTLDSADRRTLRTKIQSLVSSMVIGGDVHEALRAVPADYLLDELVREFAEFYESKNSFHDVSDSTEGDNLEEPEFSGDAYEREIDQRALFRGFMKVFQYMILNPGWHTDTEIAEATEVYVPSVQRYRSYMRSKRWGGHRMDRRRREGMRTFEYCLIPNHDSITYKYVLKTIYSPNDATLLG